MMSESNFQWTRAITLQFIDLLKQHPCLWQVKNDNYKNKIVRNSSLAAIIKALNENMNCEATQSDVMKKLHTLRSQFRKEMKDFKTSQKSGAGTDDLHVPKLWCFDALRFLTDGDVPRDATSNLDEPQVRHLPFLRSNYNDEQYALFFVTPTILSAIYRYNLY